MYSLSHDLGFAVRALSCVCPEFLLTDIVPPANEFAEAYEAMELGVLV
jgi:hypothetical protein